MRNIGISTVIKAVARFYDVAERQVPVDDDAPRTGGRSVSDARAVASYICQEHFGIPAKQVAHALNCSTSMCYGHVKNVVSGPRADIADGIAAMLREPVAPPPDLIGEPAIYASPHRPPRGPQPPERERMARWR
jgi:hypothetical protein